MRQLPSAARGITQPSLRLSVEYYHTWFSLGDDLEGDVDPVVAALLAVLRLEGGNLDAVGIHPSAVLLPVETTQDQSFTDQIEGVFLIFLVE